MYTVNHALFTKHKIILKAVQILYIVVMHLKKLKLAKEFNRSGLGLTVFADFMISV